MTFCDTHTGIEASLWTHGSTEGWMDGKTDRRGNWNSYLDVQKGRISRILICVDHGPHCVRSLRNSYFYYIFFFIFLKPNNRFHFIDGADPVEKENMSRKWLWLYHQILVALYAIGCKTYSRAGSCFIKVCSNIQGVL